jgi:hypothetical protein
MTTPRGHQPSEPQAARIHGDVLGVGSVRGSYLMETTAAIKDEFRCIAIMVAAILGKPIYW